MAATGLKSYILDNDLKSVLLLAGFPVLLASFVFGLAVLALGMSDRASSGGLGGDLVLAFSWSVRSLPLAIGVAAAWFFVAYWAQGWMIAASTGAKGVTRQAAPELYNLLENLCISRGLRTPTLLIVETPALNAYATGLNEGQYSITVTRGLLDVLDPDELEAVLGHELTHILNRDTRLMVICAIFAGIITFVAEMVWRGVRYGAIGRRSNRKGAGVLILIGLALVAVGYVVALVLRFALSRKREFMADAGSVALTKNPDAMIRALQKIDGRADFHAPGQVKAMMFESRERGLGVWLDTHPTISERIAALVKYAGGRVEAVTTAVPTT